MSRDYQSLGGRIFGYGEITVNSQVERQTKLQFVHEPFVVADRMRDIKGEPIVHIRYPNSKACSFQAFLFFRFRN